MRSRNGDGVVDDAHGGGAIGADGGAVVVAEQHAHLADDGARLLDLGDLDAAALDDEAAGFEDEEIAALLALLDQHLAGRELPLRLGLGEGKQAGHWSDPKVSDRTLARDRGERYRERGGSTPTPTLPLSGGGRPSGEISRLVMAGLDPASQPDQPHLWRVQLGPRVFARG